MSKRKSMLAHVQSRGSQKSKPLPQIKPKKENIIKILAENNIQISKSQDKNKKPSISKKEMLANKTWIKMIELFKINNNKLANYDVEKRCFLTITKHTEKLNLIKKAKKFISENSENNVDLLKLFFSKHFAP